MLGDDLPEAPVVRVVGHALEHDDCRAVRERAVDEIGVAGDPAHVRRAPEDVAGLVIEDVVVRVSGVGEVAAGGVEDALGFPGGTAGVEDEERVFRIHDLGRANRRGGGERVVPPDIAAGLHLDGRAGAADDEDFLHGRGAMGGLVGVGLHRDIVLRAAHAGVLRDDGFAGGVVDARDQRVRRERTEDDRVHCADARAGEHGDGQFGNHLHVDAHAVALADAEGFEGVRGPLHLVVEIAVGDAARLAGVVALPDEGRDIAVAGGDVAVHAVVRRVQLSPRYHWMLTGS